MKQLNESQRLVLKYVQHWGPVWFLKHRQTLQTVHALQSKGLVHMSKAGKVVKVWV